MQNVYIVVNKDGHVMNTAKSREQARQKKRSEEHYDEVCMQFGDEPQGPYTIGVYSFVKTVR